MIAKYILTGIAGFFCLLAILDLYRNGKLSPARRTHLFVAAVFLIIAAVLHFVLPAAIGG